MEKYNGWLDGNYDVPKEQGANYIIDNARNDEEFDLGYCLEFLQNLLDADKSLALEFAENYFGEPARMIDKKEMAREHRADSELER